MKHLEYGLHTYCLCRDNRARMLAKKEKKARMHARLVVWLATKSDPSQILWLYLLASDRLNYAFLGKCSLLPH